MTKVEFIKEFGLEFYEKVRYVRLLFNAQKTFIIHEKRQSNQRPIDKK